MRVLIKYLIFGVILISNLLEMNSYTRIDYHHFKSKKFTKGHERKEQIMFGYFSVINRTSFN